MIEVSSPTEKVRRLYGESQEAFGRRFGVSQSTVDRWEKGQRVPGPALVILSMLEREIATAAADCPAGPGGAAEKAAGISVDGSGGC